VRSQLQLAPRSRREPGKARRIFFHALTELGHPIHADVVIDGRFLREPPAAEVADEFADDAGVAFNAVLIAEELLK
jgi:hypothetical protein